MDRNKAKEIVKDMIVFFFCSEEIEPDLDKDVVVRLENYSLKDMIRASEILEKHPNEKYVGEDGKNYTRRMMNLDDRLIAAIYTFFHYQADSSDECSPIVSYKKQGLYKVK